MTKSTQIVLFQRITSIAISETSVCQIKHKISQTCSKWRQLGLIWKKFNVLYTLVLEENYNFTVLL